MKSIFYERLFVFNRCLEQVAEILEQFQQDGIIHAEFTRHRKQTVEDLRADLSYVLTGMFHTRELEECVAAVRKPNKPEDGDRAKS